MSLRVYILPTLKLIFFLSCVKYCSEYQMLIVTKVPKQYCAIAVYAMC